jgi:hypothetical protein
MEALMGKDFDKLEKWGIRTSYFVFLIFAVYGGYLSEMVKDSLSGIDRLLLIGIFAYGSYQLSIAFAGWLIRKVMKANYDGE